MKLRGRSILFTLIAFSAAAIGGCGGFKSPGAISVAITPAASESVDEGKPLFYTAVVANDVLNRGVTWSLSGTNCTGNGCGILSDVTNSSVTYLAPTGITVGLSVSLVATAASNVNATATAKISVVLPPTISLLTIPNGSNGVPYSQQITATGGVTPLIYSISSGTLPAGLVLTSGGTIVGTPTGSGTSNTFTVQVTDSDGAPPATQSYTLNISPPPPLAISTPGLPPAQVNNAYNAALSVSPGGVPPLTWTVSTTVPKSIPSCTSSNQLPKNLTLTSNGEITGTPTSIGCTSFNIQVIDSAIPPQQSTQSMTLIVGVAPALTIITTSLPEGSTALQYSTTLQTTGGTLPVTWSITSGQLPAGLRFDTNSGTISGVPIRVESDNVTFEAVDSESPPEAVFTTLAIQIQAQISTTVANPSLALLSGPYAFFFQGFSDVGETVIAGQFSADGKGSITSGSEDIDFVTANKTQPATSFSGAYTIDTRGRGSFQFVIPGAGGSESKPTFLFTLNSDGTARFVEADCSGPLITTVCTPTGLRGSGILKPQSASFATASLTGNYAFALHGVSTPNGFFNPNQPPPLTRTVAAGTLNADGTGKWTGELDLNVGGALTNYPNFNNGTSSYTVGSNGRGSGDFFLGGTTQVNFVLYMVSSSDFFILCNDVFPATTPPIDTIEPNFVASGEAFLQQPNNTQLAVFDNTALAGSSVASGIGLNGSSSSTFAGLLLANSQGTISSFEFDENDAGKITSTAASPATGSYEVESNGRVTFNAGTNRLSIGYLIAANQAVFIGTDSEGSVGELEPQEPIQTFNNTFLQGSYVLNYALPPESDVISFEGISQADGAGNLAGLADFVNTSNTASVAQTLTATYTTGQNSRGTLNITAPSGVTANWIFYIVSPSEVRAVSATSSDTHPAILFFNH